MKDHDPTPARAALRAALEALVGPRELPSFDLALTHPSFSNETRSAHNQRLEFLGDSVVGLCVGEQLLGELPEADEGELSRLRAALVNAHALAAWAREHGLAEALAVGRGALLQSDREQTNVLADAVEALVACVFEAGGLDAARLLVADVVRAAREAGADRAMEDVKGILQALVQAEGRPAPIYRVTLVPGTEREPEFEAEAVVGDAVLAVGRGRSKKVAERVAAAAALAARHVEPSLPSAPPPPSSS